MLILLALVVALATFSLMVPTGTASVETRGDPTATFSYSPWYPDEGEDITFDASRSTGIGLNYTWDFGDGTSGNGMIVVHSYLTTGDYIVTLVVKDADGDTDSYTDTISISAPLSAASAGVLGGMCLIYVCILGSMFLLMAGNVIIAIVVAIKLYSKANEAGVNDKLLPFLIAVIICGVIGFISTYFSLIAIIINIVIFFIARGKIDEWKAQKAAAPPRHNPAAPPPYGQPGAQYSPPPPNRPPPPR